MNNKDVLSYIEKEKKIAKFKVNILKSRFKSGDYNSDILNFEKKFIKYDFNKIEFKNIDECRKALSLFRISFELFQQKYANKRYSINFENIYNFLEKNISGIKVDGNFIDGQFIPSISNRMMYNKDDSVRSFVYKITLKQKILLNSLVKCFSNLEKYGNSYSYEDLDYFFQTIDYNIYRYYNESYDILCESNSISKKEKYKFKKLENAIILSDFVKKIDKNIFLKLCMTHSGYEKINPLYLSIKNENGTEINNSHKFKVILIDDVYYKAVEVNSFNIDYDNSHIIIAKTRREMEDFINLKTWLKSKINTIKKEFVFKKGD